VSAGRLEIAVADIGGTNARFARAWQSKEGGIALGDPVILATREYSGFADAWRTFLLQQQQFEPHGAALALAGPANLDRFKLTNANWEFDTATLLDDMAVPRLTLLNDFEAIAHAIASNVLAEDLMHIAGPPDPLPRDDTVTVIGPGTGLGIAYYSRHRGKPLIHATEGAHIDFAPVDRIDDAILAALRKRHDRVSLERVISGDGIAAIYSAIAQLEGGSAEETPGARQIWQLAMTGDEPVARAALAQFVKTLGRAAGDYALAQGASAVVLAGGIGQRLAKHYAAPAFHEAFCNKGRYRAMMEAMPIKLMVHPQPGLIGAAAAYFAQDHAQE
jgi:glucokinase